jgi:alpha-glucuronidase
MKGRMTNRQNAGRIAGTWKRQKACDITPRIEEVPGSGLSGGTRRAGCSDRIRSGYHQRRRYFNPDYAYSTMHKVALRTLCAACVMASLGATAVSADDGYELWIKYRRVADRHRLTTYRRAIRAVVVPGESRTLQLVRDELQRGLKGLLGEDPPFATTGGASNALIVVTPRHFAAVGISEHLPILPELGPEGYAIRAATIKGKKSILVIANQEIGLYYATFHLLRILQSDQTIDRLDIVSKPNIQFRVLNHWDNLDGTIERGYAGRSLWKWDELPDRISPRYRDYARANASIGINGAVLNNVNANPSILKIEHLKKVAVLATVFRPYGIRVFLSVNFSSPVSQQFEQEGNRKGGIGELETADPLDPRVRVWWKRKVQEIYRFIPDFGGFLVKANSEGMPGPQEYGRTHADGANMLAEALEPYHGIVMWRSFVYNAEIDSDRVKRAYKEFAPLDGLFHPNVFVQAKNGPLDFQPREPVQPLFGAMPRTPLMLELQITQEYLGHSTHLVYLAPMWKEYLQFDTYAEGPGSSLASIVDGTLQNYRMTGIAGVANTGDDRNWCGHLFAQANWYAFGRLAWDHHIAADDIAEEWIRMTFGNDSRVVRTVHSMMMGSWESCVNTMTPLGLHHIMQEGFHYGPGPEMDAGREDWRSTYYHRADSLGVGFDRSTRGSGAVNQYFPPLRKLFDDPRTCPEKYLLWFHHVAWTNPMRSGRTLWGELCERYAAGAAYVDTMLDQWTSLRPKIDPAIFASVKKKLEQQKRDAGEWRDTCISYFQKFSRLPPEPAY